MRSNLEKVLKKPYRSFFWWVREADEFPFEWHHHPELELTLILQGEGQRIIGPNIEEYKANDLVLIGKNIPHSYVSNTAYSKDLQKAIVIQFDRKLIDEFQKIFYETEILIGFIDTAAQGLCFKNENEKKSIIREIKNFTSLQEKYQPTALINILLRLSSMNYKTLMLTVSYNEFIKGKSNHRIEKVFEYIHENYKSPFRLSVLSSIIHMNEASFCRFFKKNTSKTVTQYIKELRISYAARLLIDTDLSVTKIAFDSGYNDLSNFSKHFKEIKHNSPLRFRNSFLEYGKRKKE